MANLPTSIKNLNTLLGEQLAEGGGGGSSDFSTAEVTLIATSGNYSVSVPFINQNMLVSSSVGQNSEDAPLVIEVPLYKGSLEISFEQFVGLADVPTCTGDIEMIDGAFLITGNCTITGAGQSG